MESCSDCIAYISSNMANISTFLLAPDVMVLYVLAYVFSSRVRASASRHAGTIVMLLPDVRTTVTILALIMAGVAILSNVGRQVVASGSSQNLPFENVFEWLGAATFFTLFQVLLTRHVTPATSYFASAATDSLWWCLTWAIWLLYQAILPGRGWVNLLGLAPLGVFGHSLLNLRFLLHSGILNASRSQT